MVLLQNYKKLNRALQLSRVKREIDSNNVIDDCRTMREFGITRAYFCNDDYTGELCADYNESILSMLRQRNSANGYSNIIRFFNGIYYKDYMFIPQTPFGIVKDWMSYDRLNDDCSFNSSYRVSVCTNNISRPVRVDEGISLKYYSNIASADAISISKYKCK